MRAQFAVAYFLKSVKHQLNVRHFAAAIDKMKYLNVAEKNDAAKTIAGLLSRGSAHRREGYSVYNKIYDFDAPVRGKPSKMIMTSVSGHLLSLEFPSSYRTWRQIDPEMLFDAPVVKQCKEDYQPIKRTLEREIRGCQGLIIWTDCDREGENIGFEIIEVCKRINPRITVHRAVFSEITSAAVQRALQNLTTPDKRQSEAVDVRTEMDLRTGAVITRYQTMRLQRLFPQSIADKLISYGSCQIPTLGFVVERYKEVEAFVEEPFWKVKVTHTIDDLTVEFNWARNRLFDKSACEDYLLLCLADPKATVVRVTVKPKHKWRPTPMDTVEMEKLGSRKLKLSAKETMSIAEKLYTKGIISYPRTETNQFSKEFDLSSLVEQQSGHPSWGDFARRVSEWGPNPRNGNKSDQAHPPIHPTKLVTDMTGNEGRLYELICRHFLACISKDAVGSETIVEITIADEKFSANGLCIHERNYLDVYIYDKWNAKQIHHYEEGQVFEPTSITMHEGSTTAPPLLTEADLIALMEKHGIGTDATHAEHINTIKERGYIGVIENGGFLVPGVIGMGLYEGYDAMELALSKPNLRASFEEDLKLICSGVKNPQIVLREQIQKYKEAYKQIMDKIQALDEKIGLRLNETPNNAGSGGGSGSDGNATAANENVENYAQSLLPCPKCNVSAPMALKQTKNKNAHFIGCMNFPDCKNVIWLPEAWSTPTVLQDQSCTQCGEAYKLLKVKLTTAYYKTLFNTPSGWYKTCLHCDRKFRDAFNINIDSVKRCGGIVGVAATTNATTATATTTTTTSRRDNSDQRRNAPAKKRTAPKTTTTTTAGGSIRSYCTTTARTTTATPPIGNNTPQIDDIEMAEFFDSNDSFDNVLVAAENNLNHAPNANTNTPDVAATDAFIDCDDDDDLFADINWGTSARQPQVSNENQTRFNSNRTNRGGATATTTDTDNYTWGTNKRPRMQDGQNSGSNTTIVRCNLCHKEAKQFTVKRDGPNKGRLFYVCSKAPPCKFFQWADDDGDNVPSTSGRSAAGAAAPTNSRISSTSLPSSSHGRRQNDGNVQRSRPTRKCGLCRKEGHTKLKCPRKTEFEY